MKIKDHSADDKSRGRSGHCTGARSKIIPSVRAVRAAGEYCSRGGAEDGIENRWEWVHTVIKPAECYGSIWREIHFFFFLESWLSSIPRFFFVLSTVLLNRYIPLDAVSEVTVSNTVFPYSISSYRSITEIYQAAEQTEQQDPIYRKHGMLLIFSK